MESLPVAIDGQLVDILAYDPRAARELLCKAGYSSGLGTDGRPLTFELLYAKLPDAQPRAEVLQQQWRKSLGFEVKLVAAELQAWISMCLQGQFGAVGDWGDYGRYVDPQWFLGQFVTGSGANGTGWNDSTYDAMVAEAERTVEPSVRMSKLAECERHLLKAMPFLPLYAESWKALQKPYIRGIGYSVLSPLLLKYASIDTNWGRA
jgi:oligopeptide transport system substrate-binding protein